MNSYAERYGDTRKWVAKTAIYATIIVWLAYAVVWLVWWIAIYLWLRVYTLLLYPFFLAAWLVLELAAVAAVVFAVMALIRRAAPDKRASVIVALVAASVFVLISFPLLWSGNVPLALLGPDFARVQ